MKIKLKKIKMILSLNGKQVPTLINDKGPVKNRLKKVQPWDPWQNGCRPCSREVGHPIQPFRDGQTPNCPEAKVQDQWKARGNGDKQWFNPQSEPSSSNEEEDEEEANEDDISTDELGTAEESSKENK